MSQIKIQSPTRVDLAGGTLDMWPLYNFTQGASTINLAISVMTEAIIDPRQDSEIHLISKDIHLSKSFQNLDELLKSDDSSLELLKAQARFWKPKQGFTLTTRSESPVGGGLGGSSSLLISIMKAFEVFTQSKPRTSHQMVNEAHNIEAAVLNTPTGTQDYYPAFSGGINILRYDESGIQQEVLDVDPEVVKDRFLLVYTGRSHHSGLNNFEVLKKAVGKDPTTMKALFSLKEISTEVEKCVRAKQWGSLGALFKAEYDSRIQLTKEFTSPEITQLAELTLHKGADAVKICGAGGGGCVMIWCSPGRREEVSQICQNAGFQVLAAKPVPPLPLKGV